MHTTEPLVLDCSPFEVENAIAKLRKYKSPGSDQISAELVPAGGKTLWSELHKLINSIWNKEELPNQWRGLSIKLTVLIVMGCHCYQFHTKFYPIFFSQG
jgi:hypothetical protein